MEEKKTSVFAGTREKRGEKTCDGFRGIRRFKPRRIVGAVASVALLGALVCSCAEDGVIVGPAPPRPNLLQNGSFEFDSVSSFDGWKVLSPLEFPADSFIRFANDTPPGGGRYSCESEFDGRKRVRICNFIDMPDTGRKYTLTVWAKAVGFTADISLEMSTRDLFLMTGRTAAVGDSTWREYTITSSFTRSDYEQYPDSSRVIGVVLSFGPLFIHPGIEGRVLFDLVRLEYVE
ncbi:MAG: hypothetical protein M1339_06255 [Bacteroidetes bacterium]|nr:hypothetical protein [Bacteroidota bacterium]